MPVPHSPPDRKGGLVRAIRRAALTRTQWALLALFGFMVWGPPRLRFDRRQFSLSEASRVAWDLNFQNAGTFDAANALHLAVWGCAGAVAFLVFGRRPREYLRAVNLRPLRWYFLYGLLCIASAVYSPSPAYTLYFGALIPIGIVVALLVRTSVSPTAPLTVLYAANGFQWAAIAVLYVCLPQVVGEYSEYGYRLTGGTFNDYGQGAALTGVFLLTTLVLRPGRRNRWVTALCILGYVASWGFILLSRTRTAMMGALMMGLIVVVFSRRRHLPLVLALAAVAVVSLMLPFGGLDALLKFLGRGETVSQLRSLTGRTVAFDYLIAAWRESPWLGYGYGAGSRQIMASFVRETGLGMGAAHDIFSRVLADLGVVGACVLFAAIADAWINLVLAWKAGRAVEATRVPLIHATAILSWVTFQSL